MENFDTRDFKMYLYVFMYKRHFETGDYERESLIRKLSIHIKKITPAKNLV